MSSDEDYYGEDEDYYAYSDDDSDEYDELGSAVYDEECTPRPRKRGYTVLSEADILQRQAEAIRDVATVLSLDPAEAAALLRHFKWSVSEVNDEWFQNEERVRKSVGMLGLEDREETSAAKAPDDDPLDGDEVTCGICFDTFPTRELKQATCNTHSFCDTCWEGYIVTAINDGPGCLNMRCPDPECAAAVREGFILDMAPDGPRHKFKRYLLRSYVDDNRNAKWCPAPGCEFAVEFFPDSSNYDVECKCGHKFCWSCNEEAHRPVDCDTVSKWIMKNSAESENMNWILAHSKACPKCKRPIEKNLGCMHMTCTPPCKHEFCWLCLGAWTDHGEKTGGFYACNRYETARTKGMYDESERRKEMAQNSLEKYTHYYERWAANEQSRAKAIESLREMHDSKIERLSERQSQPISQLKFVTDAWNQIVECRRVLKWTYAYGYYLPEEEHTKRELFEYSQCEADSALENLHRMAEKELAKYVEDDPEGGKPELPFSEFKSRLAGLTSVTHTYFENLVRALENGLDDVEQPGASKALHAHAGKGKREVKIPAPSTQASAPATSAAPQAPAGGGVSGSRTSAGGSSSAAQSSSSQSAPSGSREREHGHHRGAAGAASGLARVVKAAVRGRSSSSSAAAAANTAAAPSSRAAAGGSSTASRSQAVQEEGSYWSCNHCTYANRETATACAMCQLPRGSGRR